MFFLRVNLNLKKDVDLQTKHFKCCKIEFPYLNENVLSHSFILWLETAK